MLKHHNRLLILLVFALGVSALSVATSEARSIWASSWEQSAPSATKPRATLNGAGEPDIGDQKNNPNADPQNPANDSVLIGPNGYLWITTIWARRCLGMGW